MSVWKMNPGQFCRSDELLKVHRGQTVLRLLTREEVDGLEATVGFVPVPEPFAFYADPSPVLGPEIPRANEAELLLCVPQEAWDKIGNDWIATPDPERGFIVLFREGQPLEDDVVVPLHPQQSGPRWTRRQRWNS